MQKPIHLALLFAFLAFSKPVYAADVIPANTLISDIPQYFSNVAARIFTSMGPKIEIMAELPVYSGVVLRKGHYESTTPSLMGKNCAIQSIQGSMAGAVGISTGKKYTIDSEPEIKNGEVIIHAYKGGNFPADIEIICAGDEAMLKKLTVGQVKEDLKKDGRSAIEFLKE